METGIEFFLYLVAMAWWFRQEFNESQERRGKQRLVIDRGNPLFTELWRISQRKGSQEFILFFTDRPFTADGGLLLPTGRCKDNTSKNPFSQCENLQGSSGDSHTGERLVCGNIDNKLK